MSRISLRETYDNRSVIAQIAKVTDTAEDAAETVQEKATEINDALTDVNAAVQAAEGAVTTANAASAAAQQSAQTVAGYNTRLTTAEGEIDTLQSDMNSVTLRVQTAEGQIVTIQGRVTALETADGQNVKINRINDYAVGLTGNQSPITGTKTFTGTIEGGNINSSGGNIMLWGDQPFSKIQIKHRTDDITVTPSSAVNYPNITWRDVNGVVLCVFTVIHQTDDTISLVAQLRNTNGSNKYITIGRSDVVA